MTPGWQEAKELLQALVAVLAASRALSLGAAAALLSVAEHLLSLAGTGIVSDVRRVKEALITRLEARSEAERVAVVQRRAEVYKTLLEAVRIANPPADAEPQTRGRPLRMDEAAAELRARISQLQQEGGGLLVDVDELTAMLATGRQDVTVSVRGVESKAALGQVTISGGGTVTAAGRRAEGTGSVHTEHSQPDPETPQA